MLHNTHQHHSFWSLILFWSAMAVLCIERRKVQVQLETINYIILMHLDNFSSILRIAYKMSVCSDAKPVLLVILN